MDWVEEAPERELPEREEERELGFTSLALGASASSLWLETHTQQMLIKIHLFYFNCMPKNKEEGKLLTQLNTQ